LFSLQFYPLWLAPNVLTLTGALFCMGCYGLVCNEQFLLLLTKPEPRIKKQ
jgi:NADH:ubiquinone oxidoreductase subunit K